VFRLEGPLASMSVRRMILRCAQNDKGKGVACFGREGLVMVNGLLGLGLCYFRDAYQVIRRVRLDTVSWL
jgi:hypothetical protein